MISSSDKKWGSMVQQKTLAMKWLFLGSLITNTGISLIWPLTTIYMHEYLGEPLTVAGIVLFANSMFMVIGNSFGGWLFDHWRPYGTVLAGIGLNLFATGMLIFFHGWPAYPLLLVVSGLGSGITTTAINSYATRIQNKRPSVVFNILYFTSNLGLVIGTLIVGFVLPHGIGVVFALATGLFALFLVVALLHYRIDKVAIATATTQTVSSERNPAKPRLVMLMVTLFVTWLMYEQWQSNISAFMLGEGLTIKDYSFLWTINALLIVLFQPILTAFDRWLLQHIRLRLIGGFVLFAGSFLLLLNGSGQYITFIVAMIVLTMGEVLALPAVSTYVTLFTPLAQQGRYQGLIQGFASAGRALGPLLGAMVIEGTGSYQLLFVGATGLILLAALGFAFSVRQSIPALNDPLHPVTHQQS